MRVRRGALGLAALALFAGILAVSRASASPVLATVPLGTAPIAIAVDARTGRAFVVNNGDNTVSVFDTHMGTLLRTVAVGQNPTGIAVDERAGRVVVTDAATRVDAQAGQLVSFLLSIGAPRDVSLLDATSGYLLRRVPAAVSPLSPLIDARRGQAIVATYANDGLDSERVRVLATANGRLTQSLAMGGISLAGAIDSRDNRLILVRAPVGFDGGLGKATVDVLDTASGRLVRRSDLGGLPVPGALAVDETTGRAFMLTTDVTTNRGAVVVVDTRGGRLLGSTPLPGAPAAMATDARTGHVFVTTQGPAPRAIGVASVAPRPVGAGRVAILDARTGALLRLVEVGVAPGAVAVDGRSGRVFVANAGPVDRLGNASEPGTVNVLDAWSGVVLRTVTVGLNPDSIAVDERAGRAFVVSVGGTLRVADAWGWLPRGLRQWAPFLPPPGTRTRTAPSTVSMLDATN